MACLPAGFTLPTVATTLILATLLILDPVSGCTVVLVGRNVTADGSVIIAHTDDSGSGTCDLRLVKVRPPSRPPASSTYSIYHPTGRPRLTNTPLP
jgi:hypothetical protein